MEKLIGYYTPNELYKNIYFVDQKALDLCLEDYQKTLNEDQIKQSILNLIDHGAIFASENAPYKKEVTSDEKLDSKVEPKITDLNTAYVTKI
jgi:hypothetical protein